MMARFYDKRRWKRRAREGRPSLERDAPLLSKEGKTAKTTGGSPHRGDNSKLLKYRQMALEEHG